MSRPTRTSSDTMKRGSFVSWFTFLVGIPNGIGLLYLIHEGPVDETVKRYVAHEAEQAVVVLFCCCMAALLAKILVSMKERYVQSQPLLPTWDGKKVPVNDVKSLQQALNLAWDSAKSTFIGRRVANILNFVESRDSANELDDQMRTLSDNDVMALDSSYSLMRFIIWAIPILGFLGTVLGITQAIAGIDPTALENGTGGDNVATGLTKAFDATALALSCTLIAMFLNSIVEKMEQGLLERVDVYVDEELAHRFIRTNSDGTSPNVGMPQLWEMSMDKVEQKWSQTSVKHQEALVGAVHQALEASLTNYCQRIADMEKKLLDRQQAMVDGLGKLATVIKDSNHEHQLALARLTDSIGLSVEMLSKLQSNEAQLVRLQDSLNQNLTTLASAATFEQAVESLTAAIHLLTTRVSPAQAMTPRISPKTQAA